jgi:GNAT superfamily N-acetyltransferase
MASRAVQIEKVRAKDLGDFARAAIERASDGDLVPITGHRALSQSQNPYADEDDVGLLVARCGGKIVGYSGLLPGRLRGPAGLTKVYYGTAQYVLPEYRRRLVAVALMKEVLSVASDYAATGFNSEGKGLCEGFGLPAMGPLVFYELDLRKWNPASLPLRLARRMLATSIKRLLYGSILRAQSDLRRAVRWVQVPEFGDTEAELIAARYEKPAFYRGVECVNWMLRDKWVVEPEQAEDRCRSYHFSNTRDVFRYLPLRVYLANEGRCLGFLILSVSADTRKRSTVLKVLDFGCTDAWGYKHLTSIVVKYAAMHLADRVVLPCQLAESLQKLSSARALCSVQKRGYYWKASEARSPLARALPEIELNYCDGDCAFT